MKNAKNRVNQKTSKRQHKPKTTSNNYELNAFSITNLDKLSWEVNLYVLESVDDNDPQQEERSSIVNTMWKYKFQNKECCRGYGYIIDIDECTVAVPASWNLPSDVEFEGYYIELGNTLKIRANDPEHHYIVEKILQEAIKKQFKDLDSDELGKLWQYYRDFCQMPSESDNLYEFCRKFSVTPKTVNGLIVFQISISTITLDGHSFEWYYANGKVEVLNELISLKRENRKTRTGEDIVIKVWHDLRTEFQNDAKVLDLSDIQKIQGDSVLSEKKQSDLREGFIACASFKKDPEDIPLDKIRLILDTQITKEDHSQTLIAPEERYALMNTLKKCFDGMDAYGNTISLDRQPLKANQFIIKKALPPAIKVRKPDGIQVIDAPKKFSYKAILNRSRERAISIRRHGFLQHRPINPALAWPESAKNVHAAKRMKNDLNKILERRKIGYQFKYLIYSDVEDMRNKAINSGYDSLLVVLPKPNGKIDFHEEVKKRIELPSQCIKIKNTLPVKWQKKNRWEFKISSLVE